MSGRYHGQPVSAYLSLQIDLRHFDRWLALFEQAALDVRLLAAAADFAEKARPDRGQLRDGDRSAGWPDRHAAAWRASLTGSIRRPSGSPQSRFGGEMTKSREPHNGLSGKFLREFHAVLVGGAVRVLKIDVG